MKNGVEFVKSTLHSRKFYMLANYFAYSLNFLSGLILARTLGVEQRGVLAFITSFYLITLLLASFNSKNGSSFANIKNPNESAVISNFPFRRLFLRVFSVSISCTAILDLFLFKKIETNNLIFFSISSITCGLTFYIFFAEGIFRVEEKNLDLAVLRFLGLATPSLYVLLILVFDKVEVKYLLLSQGVAMISCTIFLIARGPLKINFSYYEYSEQVKKTFFGYVLEFLSNIMIVLSVTLTSSNETIGYFAIAMSFALISDTFFPVVESRMFNKIHTHNANRISLNLSPLIVAIKEVIAGQLVFICLAFAIPVIYGDEYTASVYFAIVLVFVKCMHSVVKLCSSYAVISNRFDIQRILNLFYILMYIVIFCVIHAFNFQGAWQLASTLASFLAASVGLILTRGFAPKRIILPTNQRNSGSKFV